MATVQQLAYNTQNKENVKELNLSSTSHFKLYRITKLQQFVNLRILVLSNNMIEKIQNLHSLTKLRVLNLEFNQITVLQGTENLTQLEEIQASYNQIQQIHSCIALNTKLKILHLAYNDLKYLEDIGPLYHPQPLNISILSLHGNPLISALNYQSLIKMLIPHLVMIDDRDISANPPAQVNLHEEVTILREALNKLIDQRNQAMQQLKEVHSDKKQSFSHQFEEEKQQLIRYLEKHLAKNLNQLEKLKEKINDLSEIYTSNMKKQKTKDQSKNRQILKQIKETEKEIGSKKLLIKQKKTHILAIKQIKETSDFYQYILYKVLFGEQGKNTPITLQKQFSKIETFMNFKDGMAEKVRKMKAIIFGNEDIEDQYIPEISQNLNGKCLIEIIDSLKVLREKEKKNRQSFEEERKKFVHEFQKQTKCLWTNWEKLNEEKKTYERRVITDKINQSKNEEQKTKKLKEKFIQIEHEEKQKITSLKKQKEVLKQTIIDLNEQYHTLELNFQRKCNELQEFEKWFQEFKNEKEAMEITKEQLETITDQLHSKSKYLDQLNSSINKKIQEEAILKESTKNLLQNYKLIEGDCQMMEKRIKDGDERLQKAQQEEKRLKIQLTEKIKKTHEIQLQYKQNEKLAERAKRNFLVLEEKLKNIEKMEQSKQNHIKQVQNLIKNHEREREDIVLQNRKLEKQLSHKRQELIKLELKIQEAKLTMESLKDINKSIADMLERQTELKRSILELEIQNKNLRSLNERMKEEEVLKQYI